MQYVFFGSPEFAVDVLNELWDAQLPPTLIITQPAKPKGRKLLLTPTPAYDWAVAHGIAVKTPEQVKGNQELLRELREVHADCFVVAAYGKILPKELLTIPPHGVLNVHPSLLPKFRGSSPVESFILSDEKETGTTIILLDEEMDHGPIVSQEILQLPYAPMKGGELEHLLASQGGKLLGKILRSLKISHITASPQIHEHATYTKKIKKEDGMINLQDDPHSNLKKIRAFDPWPGAYTFFHKDGKELRVRINDAKLSSDGHLEILRVTPEGKSEMPYEDFVRGYGSLDRH